MLIRLSKEIRLLSIQSFYLFLYTKCFFCSFLDNDIIDYRRAFLISLYFADVNSLIKIKRESIDVGRWWTSKFSYEIKTDMSISISWILGYLRYTIQKFLSFFCASRGLEEKKISGVR